VTWPRTISVTIPAGIDDGVKLRLNGQGEASSQGGPPGDLYVAVRVAPHKLFTRQGKQILVQVGVNVAQAALGDEIEIDTLDGAVAFKLPGGTQSGQQFRLRGKGVPDVRGGDRGDQVITIHVMTPKQLTPDQRELFERLGESLGNAITQQPAQRGFFDKIKDALGV
jgi:molecular chaperone DnaJ